MQRWEQTRQLSHRRLFSTSSGTYYLKKIAGLRNWSFFQLLWRDTRIFASPELVRLFKEQEQSAELNFCTVVPLQLYEKRFLPWLMVIGFSAVSWDYQNPLSLMPCHCHHEQNSLDKPWRSSGNVLEPGKLRVSRLPIWSYSALNHRWSRSAD